MTDHELCLAAAKAAGYTVESVHGGWYHCTAPKVPNRIWNPLKSDMDAFRLMVDCGIDVEYINESVEASCWTRGAYSDLLRATETFDTDKHAATRRAIVRAAAAMGSQ